MVIDVRMRKDQVRGELARHFPEFAFEGFAIPWQESVGELMYDHITLHGPCEEAFGGPLRFDCALTASRAYQPMHFHLFVGVQQI